VLLRRPRLGANSLLRPSALIETLARVSGICSPEYPFAR
jgi:hypothetical protein